MNVLWILYPGVLLPEMLMCMALLQLRSPAIVQMSGAVVILQETLDILDNYNRLAPGLGRDDKEDLSWPGVWSMCISILHRFFRCDRNYNCVWWKQGSELFRQNCYHKELVFSILIKYCLHLYEISFWQGIISVKFQLVYMLSYFCFKKPRV